MPKKNTVKIKKKIFIKCKKCDNEIFSDTNKNMIYCKCGAVAVDGCDDYVRIIGGKEDFEILEK